MASTVKTLIKSVRQYKRPSIITPLFMAVEAFCECLIPFFMAKMIDTHALSQANAMRHVLTYGGILLVNRVRQHLCRTAKSSERCMVKNRGK